MGLSRAALQEEGPESGAIVAKGLHAPGGTTRTHPGSQAEQVFGQGDRVEQGQSVRFHQGSEAASVS